MSPAATTKKSRKPVPKRPVSSPDSAPASQLSLTQQTPDAKSYWRKYRYYLLVFVLSLVVFGACAWLVRRSAPHALEIRGLRAINTWPDGLRIAFVGVAALGSVWTAAVGVSLTFLLRLYQLAWRLALSTLTAYGLLIVLKDFFPRPRPFEFIPELSVRIAETGFAFPSTHATIATVLALTVRTYLPIPRIWQWIVVGAWIFGVALSKMYLGVHAPLDVLAGIALGAGVVCFWRVLPRSIKKMLRLA